MSANSTAEPVVIIGGGISGLSAAYFLSQRGIRSVLIEKSGRLGGLIKTDLVGGCELEAGPDSFIAAKPAVAELARQLGIESQIIGSNDGQRRIFIVRDGKLAQMPKGMVMMVPGDLSAALRSRFFSPASKFRFLTEIFSRPRVRPADLSIREFVTDHFGPQCLEYVTEPLLSGVFGGDSAGLSARSVLPRFLDYERKYGSLIRAVARERSQAPSKTSLFLSFQGGMQTLTDALQRAIAPSAEILTAEASRVKKTATGWRVHFGGEFIESRDVILCCPAHVNSALLSDSAPALSQQLSAIPHSSAILVTLVYDRPELSHPLDGFGFLVPRSERRGIAAGTWVTTKFPSRTPPNRVALRAFIVAEDAIASMEAPDTELVQVARREFSRLMNVDAKPLFSAVYRWPRSMPQYVVGHGQRRENIAVEAAQLAGLHLCGNAYEGVGIPDCVRLAEEVALLIAKRR